MDNEKLPEVEYVTKEHFDKAMQAQAGLAQDACAALMIMLGFTPQQHEEHAELMSDIMFKRMGQDHLSRK